ncbi:hypothetical protein A2U01_0063155, partial [Trifolium medium]|nr:hypothetical protein [Trifolium medium]
MNHSVEHAVAVVAIDAIAVAAADAVVV